eukprot:CAMPEP_0171309092 /NCGR_PEP_ID=MMETSP0816-20121228/19229_1 /TAXON_ID=420281 /ORGANISM="Proboscia inermis, Strain CCAP1064/1" /LENGTH=72 /DNA_ID=CAMNT_0011792383 /DNA_START=128 /DNA_END=343 /DNA_ORIENTATION=+
MKTFLIKTSAMKSRSAADTRQCNVKSSKKKKTAADQHYAGEIDPKVFAELPFHIQALVQKEMYATKPKDLKR